MTVCVSLPEVGNRLVEAPAELVDVGLSGKGKAAAIFEEEEQIGGDLVLRLA